MVVMQTYSHPKETLHYIILYYAQGNKQDAMTLNSNNQIDVQSRAEGPSFKKDTPNAVKMKRR